MINDLIYQFSDIGILVLDSNKNIVNANPAFCKMIEYEEADLIGQPVTILFQTDMDVSQLESVIKGEIPLYRKEREYRTKTGKSLWVKGMLSKTDGQFLGVIEDITLTKVREAEAKEAYEQAKMYAQDLLQEIDRRKETEAKLNQTVSELEKFVYAASHDLQEPLRTIHAMAELMEQDISEAPDAIKTILNSSELMQKLIIALLYYARIGFLDREWVSINDVLSQVISNLTVIIEEKGAKIEVDCEDIQVYAGEVYIYRLFQNLIQNSLKYSDKAPIIKVSCHKEGECYTFSVSDNGVGIEKQYWDYIFVIFKKLQEGGMGIGLSECKKIVELYGGTIWLESEVGVGTTFYFTLPC